MLMTECLTNSMSCADTLALPNCLSPFSVDVSTAKAAGLNFPTGALSLAFTGGALKSATIEFDTTVSPPSAALPITAMLFSHVQHPQDSSIAYVRKPSML